MLAVQPEVLAGAHLVADVNLRGGVLAHQHGGEAGRYARGLQLRDLLAEFFLDLFSNRGSVEYPRGHVAPADLGIITQSLQATNRLGAV